LRLSSLERRYRQRLQECWEREPSSPSEEFFDGLIERAEAELRKASERARRLVHSAQRERRSLLKDEQARSVKLRFKAEERLRFIEQRTEESARARGLQRGLEEGNRQCRGIMSEAEELLVEAQEARYALVQDCREEAVELALVMTRKLLGLLPEEMPEVLRPALQRLVAQAEVGHGAVLRCHPSRAELLRQLPSVQEGKIRLELDPDSPPQRMRIHGHEGVGEIDLERGLQKMEGTLRRLLFSGDAEE
jgi:flagellar biosynthesis/type III secretory pathway protein FliH